MNFETKDFFFREEDRTVVIAEIGVNHNGDPSLAKRMVDVAKEAGADVVKFQSFKSEKEISRYAPKAAYQEEATQDTANQLEMCKALELSPSVLREMKEYCASVGMPFLCTAFEFDSVDLLVDELRLETIKIPSGEITNIPLLKYVGAKRKEVVLSTGASTLTEVGKAIETLKNAGTKEILLFHCVSSYPAPYDQVNLRAMTTLKQAFGLPVGYSDHTRGNHAALSAVALGAAAIEKHFTLDRTMTGPDHQASIEPHELKELVQGVRIVHQTLGSGRKEPAPCEAPNLPLIRKSLVAGRHLTKGTRLQIDMIEIKRPANGIEPGDLEKILGLTLKHDLKEDMPLRWEDLA
jgi:N-acetylneuraminate synthase